MKSLSHVQLFVTPWTATSQAALSMGFFRQEYWRGLPFPSPGIFPTQGLNPDLLHCRRTLYPLSHQGSPFSFGKAHPFFQHEAKGSQSCGLTWSSLQSKNPALQSHLGFISFLFRRHPNSAQLHLDCYLSSTLSQLFWWPHQPPSHSTLNCEIIRRVKSPIHMIS